MKIHPSDDLLQEFLLSLGEGHRSLLWHLAKCAHCRSRLYYLPREEPPAAEAEDPLTYRQAFEDSRRTALQWEAALAQERREAPGLLVDLLDRPAGERAALARTNPRFQTWGLFELLVERSWETCVQQPAWAEEIGRLALELSEKLDPVRYRAELIEDLRARAWAYLGNARRVLSDLEGSEEAFAAARIHLEKGTGEPLERALLLDLEASLLRARRRFAEAERSLRRAVSIFRRTGDLHRAGRSLVNLSTVLNYSTRSEESIPVLYEAIESIDAEREPRLRLCAWHNLIVVLTDLGRFDEAWSLYGRARPIYRSFPDAWAQNRRKWVRAKILYGLGRPRLAESLFRAVRDGFVAEGIPYDTALVSLELATLYAEQGRTADLKRLADEMMPIFTSRHIHREALAALTLLKRAAEAERATLELVTRIASYIRRAEHEPEMPFEAGSLA